LLSRAYGINAAAAMLRGLQLKQQEEQQKALQQQHLRQLQQRHQQLARPPLFYMRILEDSPATTAPTLTPTLSPPTPRRRGSPKRSREESLACHVCGDAAPNHVHYGGIACFSCRAFFRRSVPKHLGYYCSAEGRCKITMETRKNCQRCR